MTQRNQILRSMGLVLLLVGIIVAGSELYQSYTGVVIYADETHPKIKESATTHGKIAYPSQGKPTVTCFIQENMEMKQVSVEIRTPGGMFGLGSEKIEEIQLEFKSKTADIFKYQGTFTESLNENIKYKLIYKATDRVELEDSYTTELELVQIAGVVKVNGVKVTSPTQTIYSKDLTLHIEVEITQGKNSIENLALHLEGKKLQAFEAAAGGTWILSHELPEDGRYTFMVQVLASGGESIQLASFSVDMGSSLNPWVLAGAVGLVAVVSGVLMYKEK